MDTKKGSITMIKFFDKHGKPIVTCGKGQDTKQIKIPEGQKIVYAYGGNSIDGKSVGMLGFTIWNC